MTARVVTPSVLEALLTSREAFGLDTATNLQRAICRCSDGVPLAELWDDPNVREGFGGVLPPAVAPRTLVILAAIRGAKSMIAAAKAFETALTCDVSGLQPGDILRIPVLSIDKRGATQVFKHLVGTILAKPALRQHMVGEPTADTVQIRHQSGRIVEVTVTALSAQGGTLVGNWLASCIFDEAPRMAGSADGVRNLDDALHAIQMRMRPGAQIMIIGSPNIPFGPVYEMNQEFFGKPSEQMVVIRGTGPILNPVWWTPERVEWARVHAPRSYQTDCLGKFADSEDQLFSSVVVDAAMRKAPDVIKRRPEHEYVAAMDPAMRGNGWTLVVLGCDGENERGEPTYYVALAMQWRGSKAQPLRPDLVLRDCSRELAAYGLREVWSDGHQIDSLRVLAEHEGIEIMETHSTQEDTVLGVENVRLLIESERLELSPDRTMRADLLRVRRKVNQKNVTMSMPVTADGRHCDYVPSLVKCLQFAPGTPKRPGIQRDQGLAAAVAAVEARKGGGSAVLGLFRSGIDG